MLLNAQCVNKSNICFNSGRSPSSITHSGLCMKDISTDFIEALPKSEGYDVILVVVDRLSKYVAYFIPLKHAFGAKVVVVIFIRKIIRLHGCSQSIVSDHDRIFTSLFWEELWHLWETQLRRSPTYHPQMNGQIKVVNREETYLQCFAMNTPKQWVKWLALAELSYNTIVHTTTLMTPFEALYGRPPPSILPYVKDSSPVNEVDHFILKER